MDSLCFINWITIRRVWRLVHADASHMEIIQSNDSGTNVFLSKCSKQEILKFQNCLSNTICVICLRVTVCSYKPFQFWEVLSERLYSKKDTFQFLLPQTSILFFFFYFINTRVSTSVFRIWQQKHTPRQKSIRALEIVLAIFLCFECQFLSFYACYKEYKA